MILRSVMSEDDFDPDPPGAVGNLQSALHRRGRVHGFVLVAAGFAGVALVVAIARRKMRVRFGAHPKRRGMMRFFRRR